MPQKMSKKSPEIYPKIYPKFGEYFGKTIWWKILFLKDIFDDIYLFPRDIFWEQLRLFGSQRFVEAWLPIKKVLGLPCNKVGSFRGMFRGIFYDIFYTPKRYF